ncbi:hypothetical protein [Polymorphospora sp. NPDC050346]|uniref:hypothetical protein n=1 Tax=Polymorphospora sp. NPDC050346 TaxID=3155780 RepID=UPI003404F885
MCNPLDPFCSPIGQVAGASAERFLETLAEQASEAAAEMLKAMVTGWLTIPAPSVDQESGPVAYLRTYTNWAVAAIAVGAVLIAALKIAWERNGREAGELARGLVALVVITGAGVPAIRLLTQTGDSYSNWILNAAADGDLGERLLLLAPSAAFTGMPSMLILGLSLFLFLAALTQLLLLLGHGGGLILLAGLVPVAAAAGITGGGRAVLGRYLTWGVALILYKPTAATIYAGAFWTIGKAQDLTTLLTGLVMICMAIAALPALLRLLAPPVAMLTGGGGSSGSAAAGIAAAGQLATGAIRLASSGGGGKAPTAPASSTSASDGPTGSTPAALPAGGGRPALGSSGKTPLPPGGSSPALGGSPLSTPPPTGPAPTPVGVPPTGPIGSAGGGAAATAGGGGAAAAGVGGGAAAAAGPAGLAAGAAITAAKAGPQAVRKVGGTAATGAAESEST